MTKIHRVLRPAALGLALAATGLSSQAAMFDFLFGDGKTDPAEAGATRQTWPVAEFSEVRIVAGESGAPPNSHPARVTEEKLRLLLGAVRTTVGGNEEPLFAPDELADIVGPIQKALALATPTEDVLLRSASRRGASRFSAPLAVTARLFVLGERLNLIVMENRNDFFLRYRAAGKLPAFSYGSRAVESKVSLRHLGVPGQRGDWLEIPLSGEPAPMPVAKAPAAPAAPAAVAPAAAAAVAPSAAAVNLPAAPARPRDAAFAEEVEQRLQTLKRLRDKGLITEEEFQQKRREVLALL